MLDMFPSSSATWGFILFTVVTKFILTRLAPRISEYPGDVRFCVVFSRGVLRYFRGCDLSILFPLAAILQCRVKTHGGVCELLSLKPKNS
ncbi:hypothetical protein FKM82_023932 [Ascaphus truei]